MPILALADPVLVLLAWLVVGLVHLPAAAGFPAHLDAVRPGEHPVHDGIGDGLLLAHGRVPGCNRQLGGDDHGPGGVAVLHDLKQIRRLLGGERPKGQIVDLSRCRDKSTYPDVGIIPIGKTNASSRLPSELVSALAYRDNFRCFYVMSSRERDLGRIAQAPVDLAGDVALQQPLDLLGGFSLRLPALHIGPGFRVMGHPGQSDGGERPVEAAVASAVEAMTLGVTRGCGNGTGSREGGKGVGGHEIIPSGGHQERPTYGHQLSLCAAMGFPHARPRN